jgi:uncharacterized membrane protein YgcG
MMYNYQHMECPHCAAKMAGAPDACPRCDFSLAKLTAALGCDLFGIRRLADDAHCLKLQESREIEALLEDFEQHFPQVFVTVYLGVLPTPLSVRELAFLLLNRGAFSAGEHPRLNEFAVALVVDPVARTAALMTGYALERWLPPRRMHRILRGIRTCLWHGEYVAAVTSTLRGLEKGLRKAARRESRRHVLPPISPEDFLSASKFRPLRTSLAAENDPAVRPTPAPAPREPLRLRFSDEY